MHNRARELISKLSLQPHPEGGYFREIFRSAHKVQPLDERSARSALTTIYFLLTKGQHGERTRRSSQAFLFMKCILGNCSNGKSLRRKLKLPRRR